MAKHTVDELIQLSNRMFTNQSTMLPLYQTISEHFYPERADFTIQRNVGQELAANLVDSYPVLVRRDLGNSFSSVLRDGDWFRLTVDSDPDHNGKMWLQWATDRLRKLFYHTNANFVRSTKEGDHDFATFGQCVLSVERNKKANGLLFRNWHLKDVAWFDGCDGKVEGVTRRWSPTYKDLVRYFGGEKVHKEITDQVFREPFKSADIRHIVIPAEMYGEDELTEKYKYVSVYIDVARQHLIELNGQNHPYYVIPRFQTIAGSPYAYSPATVVGLPDARTLQAMTYTLLEAGERYARPPIIATQNAIRSDIDLSADGITYVDDEYDVRTGDPLRTLPQNMGGFPIGADLRQNIVQVMSSAFYVDKLSLPEVSREMTAYEVQERMKQYRRENLPLFAPTESEYNGQLCEIAFDLAFSSGFLGSPYDVPDSLSGRDVVFKFESPLSQSDEEKKATQFSQTSKLLAEAAQFDQSIAHNINFDVALRDAVMGAGAPATWLRSIDEVLQSRQSDQMQMALQQAAEMQGVA